MTWATRKVSFPVDCDLLECRCGHKFAIFGVIETLGVYEEDRAEFMPQERVYYCPYYGRKWESVSNDHGRAATKAKADNKGEK